MLNYILLHFYSLNITFLGLDDSELKAMDDESKFVATFSFDAINSMKEAFNNEIVLFHSS
jgi:hypothetical protein